MDLEKFTLADDEFVGGRVEVYEYLGEPLAVVISGKLG